MVFTLGGDGNAKLKSFTCSCRRSVKEPLKYACISNLNIKCRVYVIYSKLKIGNNL